jgi:hypothetical protein
MTDECSKGPQPRPIPQAIVEALKSARPWQVQIDVYLEDDECDPPRFRIESCLPVCPTSTANDKILVFENNHRPGFDILFHLWDLTGKGYRFPRRPEHAIWSAKGDACPMEAAHDVFDAIRTGDDPHTGLPMLLVHNDNPGKDNGGPIRRFRYTLNVTRDDGAHYLRLDPGGDDQNGMRSFTFS